MNMMVVACGDTAILIDAGVMFPEPELLGVDLIIPDLRQLQQYPIRAMVQTHGHEGRRRRRSWLGRLRRGGLAATLRVKPRSQRRGNDENDKQSLNSPFSETRHRKSSSYSA